MFEQSTELMPGSPRYRFLETGMSNARVLMQKIHAARDVIPNP